MTLHAVPTPHTVPHDLAAERAVLGAVLLSPDVLHEAQAAGIEATSFYREPHRQVWRAMCATARAGALDLVSLTGALETVGALDQVGGYSYIAGLSAAVPSIVNIATHVDTVLRKARARALLVDCADATGRITQGDDPDDVRASLASRLVAGTAEDATCEAMGESVHKAWDWLRSTDPDVEVLRTPWARLNGAVRGVYVGELTVIVGQPRTGKSVIADQIATSWAVDQGIPGCVFALEMTRPQMMLRRIASRASVDYAALQDRRLSNDDLAAVWQAHGELETAALWTDDAMLTMEQIWARAKAGARRYGWMWIVIDHAHIVRASDQRANRIDQLGHIGLLGKQIAKDCGIAVLLPAQMNSDAKKRTDRRPQMGDIAYGTTLEQSAATILGLHRQELHEPSTSMRGVLEVVPIKTRFGVGNPVSLTWQGHYQRAVGMHASEQEAWK